MKDEEKKIDCTDCIHYAICYLRRHRKDKDNLTVCEDIELFDVEVEE